MVWRSELGWISSKLIMLRNLSTSMSQTFKTWYFIICDFTFFSFLFYEVFTQNFIDVHCCHEFSHPHVSRIIIFNLLYIARNKHGKLNNLHVILFCPSYRYLQSFICVFWGTYKHHLRGMMQNRMQYAHCMCVFNLMHMLIINNLYYNLILLFYKQYEYGILVGPFKDVRPCLFRYSPWITLYIFMEIAMNILSVKAILPSYFYSWSPIMQHSANTKFWGSGETYVI